MVTVGGDEDEEVLRREMAMGAKQGVLLSDEAFRGSDGQGIATILKAFVAEGALRPDPDRRPGRGRRAPRWAGCWRPCWTIRSPRW